MLYLRRSRQKSAILPVHALFLNLEIKYIYLLTVYFPGQKKMFRILKMFNIERLSITHRDGILMVKQGTEFQILDLLDRKEITSQRQLSDKTGISLGQINYVIKRLLAKGWIKIGNFKKNPRKIGYAYLLTPKGFEAKSRLAVKFVLSRLKEYDTLRDRLSRKLAAIQHQGNSRIIFVGPDPVRELIHSIIKDLQLQVRLVDHFSSLEDLKNSGTAGFDMALWLDDAFDGLSKLPDQLGIPAEKLTPLW